MVISPRTPSVAMFESSTFESSKLNRKFLVERNLSSIEHSMERPNVRTRMRIEQELY